MTDLLSSSQFWLLVSIGFYALGVEIQKKTGSAVCNPLLIASILVGALLIATGTPYQTYEESGKLISFFLTPATVALAIPIYRKLDVLLKNLLPILLGAFVENQLVAMASVLPVSDSHERYRHRGGFGISVLQGYWNQGIASLLMPSGVRMRPSGRL